MQETPFHIILADDDIHDHFFFKEAVLHFKNIKVTSVYDGDELMNYLLKKNEYRSNTDVTPSCILLDINMPGFSGFEVLNLLKTDPYLPKLPVFLWSTDGSTSTRKLARNCGAVDLFTKESGQYESIASSILTQLTLIAR